MYYHEQHYKVKRQLINVDRNDDATYPNPNPTAYLAGNLANNFLAIKLFWYGSGTFQLEIVHRNFLTLSSANLTYIITHIHTNIAYSTSGSIVDIMNKIVVDISQIPQYNIWYGSNDATTNYNGLISNYKTNGYGFPVMNFTTATMKQLQMGLQNNMAKFPAYTEQSYHDQ